MRTMRYHRAREGCEIIHKSLPAKLLLAGLVYGFALMPIGAAASVPEYQVKAQLIQRFASFANWPVASLAPSSNLVVCVAGDSPVTRHLRQVAKQGPIRGHRLEVRTVKLPNGAKACHVLFLPSQARGRLADTLARLRGEPVLTIGDTDGFGRRGVMINLSLSRHAVRFTINRKALSATALRLPAKVLRLAINGGHR